MRLVEVDHSDLEGYSAALIDIFEARLTGMVIHGAFPPEAVAQVVARLEAGDIGLESRASPAFVGETYGRVLIVGDRDLDSYFEEAGRFRAACAALFEGAPDFQQRIEALLGAIAGGRAVGVPAGPQGDAYAPATIRGLHEGGQIDLHCENETVDFPSMWHLSRLIHARNQLSFYVLLGVPESGGELVIHNARYAEGPGELLGRLERDDPATLEMLAPYGHVVPHTRAGDLLVFDSGRHFHRVTPVVGPRRRWTMGGFLARSLDENTVYYWS